MILKGIVEESFGGITIFRGFATLRSLATHSSAKDYQRPVSDDRLSDLVEFMKNGLYRFFPELIFSLQFNDISAITKIKLELKSGSAILSDGIKIKKAKFLFQPIIGDNPTTKVMSIEFPSSTEKILSRIDGNHRLTAADNILALEDIDAATIELKQRIGDLIVPFCILLQTKGDDADKYESALFHLINARAEPLTTEENLKAIFSIESFTSIERDQLLGLDSEYVKKFIDHFTTNNYSFVADVFQDKIYTLSMELGKLIDSGVSDGKIIDSIRCIDNLFRDGELYLVNRNITLALLKIKSTENIQVFRVFVKWLVNNNLIEIKHILPTELIDIFERTHQKGSYKVFVAIPYVSHQHVQDFNKLFSEVLEEIQEKEDVKLELIPIMRFRGNSQRIDARLIQHIKECDIFIADLTGANDNVIYEIGLAEGNDKPMILIKEDNDYAKVPFDKNEEYNNKSNVPFDMDKLQWIPYERYGYYNQIKSIIRNNLPEILKQKYNE